MACSMTAGSKLFTPSVRTTPLAFSAANAAISSSVNSCAAGPCSCSSGRDLEAEVLEASLGAGHDGAGGKVPPDAAGAGGRKVPALGGDYQGVPVAASQGASEPRLRLAAE
jgi:hypothetical protein